MAPVSFIIFLVDQDLYGLETRVVKEVIWVPELLLHPSCPTGIAGMFSYRGTVIPVLDFYQGVGRRPRNIRIDDQVIIVEWEERVVGLLIDKVLDVTSEVVEPVNDFPPRATVQGPAGHGVVAVANIGGQTVKMLDLARMLQNLQVFESRVDWNSLASGIWEGKSAGQTDMGFSVSSKGFGELTQEDRHLLRDRTDALAQSERVVDANEWITLAVARLNEEYVGFDPLVVREFAKLSDLVPIPCCPNFILGHMNLRGEVLTVFDLRYVLNMPVPENLPLSQVAVIQVDTCLMGIAVQEILDCISCQSNNGGSSPMGGEGGSFMNEVSHYRGKALKKLDVLRLLSSKVLEIYEEV